jgi:hypothetical protein
VHSRRLRRPGQDPDPDQVRDRARPRQCYFCSVGRCPPLLPSPPPFCAHAGTEWT